MKKIRQLEIQAIATKNFQNHYKNSWQQVIKETIKKCSKVYEKNFGIKLFLKKIRTKRFVTRTSFVPHRIFDYERAFEKEGCDKFDITIAFTNAPFFAGHDDIGFAFHTHKNETQRYENLIILTNPEKWDWKYINWSFLTSLLIHEIGHVFRAKDTKRAKSYMSKQINTESYSFYYAEKRIILKNKWQKLRLSAPN